MKPDLIITNGDSAADLMRQAGFSAVILPWRDCLHEGPVPDLPARELVSVRAEFLSRHAGLPADRIAADLCERDAMAADRQSYDQVSLWFEHDLYDQLQLMQILARFAERLPDLEARPIGLVQADTYLSDYTPDNIGTLQTIQRLVTADDVACAADVWTAFSGGDPTALNDWLGAAMPFPHLAEALRRLAQDFPHRGTGLTLTETRILEVLRREPISAGKLFGKVQASEAAKFMGDLSFAACLDRLCFAPAPLIEGLPGPLSGHMDLHQIYFASELAPTPFGREVFAGRENNIRKNSIERWIGGAHLTSKCHWVWTGARLEPA